MKYNCDRCAGLFEEDDLTLIGPWGYCHECMKMWDKDIEEYFRDNPCPPDE